MTEFGFCSGKDDILLMIYETTLKELLTFTIESTHPWLGMLTSQEL